MLLDYFKLVFMKYNLVLRNDIKNYKNPLPNFNYIQKYLLEKVSKMIKSVCMLINLVFYVLFYTITKHYKII